MRNWNYNKPWQYRKGFTVSTLPMRNWNEFFLFFINNCNNCFHFTYEELKFVFQCLQPTLNIRFPLYLWGIEIFFFFYFHFNPLKFPLYLWGIEIDKVGAKVVGGNRFHFTYEELKYSGSKRPIKRQNCFHFTYEELKFKNNGIGIYPLKKMFPLYLWGIEIDLALKMKMRAMQLVSTLPMRNWNRT